MLVAYGVSALGVLFYCALTAAVRKNYLDGKKKCREAKAEVESLLKQLKDERRDFADCTLDELTSFMDELKTIAKSSQ